MFHILQCYVIYVLQERSHSHRFQVTRVGRAADYLRMTSTRDLSYQNYLSGHGNRMRKS